MLDTLRQNASHWSLKVALGVIALVFIFWGFGAQNMGDPSQFAVKVNGEPIPYERFVRMFEQQLEQSQGRNRGLPGDIQERMIQNQILEQLIEDELLWQFAEQSNIHVSDAELAQRITESPEFQDETTGSFIGKKKYLELLRNNGIDPARWEEDIRKGLVTSKARQFVESAVKVGADEVKQEWRARNEKINLQFLRVDTAAMASLLEKEPVKDSEVSAFEGKFPGLAEQLYEEGKASRWTTPASAKIRQITVRKPQPGKGDAAAAKRKAERALEMAASDWKKAADQYSEGQAWEKSGDAREVARRELPSAVADAAFSMQPGSAATLVESPTSFTILKVESIRPEKVTELDEKVKKEILIEQVRTKRAEALVETVAREAFEKIKAGQSIDKFATSKGLAVKETGPFTIRQTLPGVPETDEALTAAAFKLSKPGDVLEHNGGIPRAGDSYVIAVLKEHIHPNETTYEQDKVMVQGMMEKLRSTEAFRSWKADRVAESRVVYNPQLLPNG